MEFDLTKEYERYSNVDLLRIVQLPDQYQPAAVELAKTILARRVVTEEEQTLSREMIAPKSSKKNIVPDAENREPGNDIFRDATEPRFAAIKGVWLVLSIIMGVTILYYVKQEISAFMSTPVIPSARWDTYFNVLVVAAQLTGFIAFLQKKKWSWKVNIVWLGYLLITGVFSLVVLLANGLVAHAVSITIQLAAYLLCTVLLCENKLRDFFSVSRRAMVLTLLITFGCTLTYAGIVITALSVLDKN